MPWGAIIGSVAGALISSSGSSDAASAQAGASNAATAEQGREFDYLQQIYGPQRNLGYGADQALASLFGFSNPMAGYGSPGAGGGGGYSLFGGAAPYSGGAPTPFGKGGGPGGGWAYPMGVGGPRGGGPAGGTPTAGAPPNYAGFFNSPGYQFALNTGENAIKKEASATGGLYSTNTLLGLNTFAQGQASQHYNDYVNQLLQMAGLGSAAVSGTAGAATTVGSNIGANILSAGNANASGALGNASAWSNAASQLGGVNWSRLFGGGGGGTPDTTDYNTIQPGSI